jgi:hypothetical protein
VQFPRGNRLEQRRKLAHEPRRHHAAHGGVFGEPELVDAIGVQARARAGSVHAPPRRIARVLAAAASSKSGHHGALYRFVTTRDDDDDDHASAQTNDPDECTTQTSARPRRVHDPDECMPRRVHDTDECMPRRAREETAPGGEIEIVLEPFRAMTAR